MTPSRDGPPLALLGAGGLVAVAALAALLADAHALSAALAVAAVVAAGAGVLVPGRDRPSVFEVPLRYRVVVLSPLALPAGIVVDADGADRPGGALLPVVTALGVLVVVLCAGVGRRAEAWSHLLAAAAVGGPLLLVAGAVPGAGMPAALVVAVVVLVPAVAADRAERPAPDRRVSVALVVAGALVGVVVRAAVPGSRPAVWVPLLLVPVVVATVSWVVAARGGADRSRTPTSGSGVVPR